MNTAAHPPERPSTKAASSRPKLPPIALPDPALSLEQGEEWIVAKLGGAWEQIGIHDYDRLYEVPGLYEHLVYDILGCNSPSIVVGLLAALLEERNTSAPQVRVLDLGAGNGIVGEELARIGVHRMVAVDIIQSAAKAARRDRPNIYEDYVVGDITQPTIRKHLAARPFDAMTCVAALGFGDIPPAAFAATYNLVRDDGVVAFTIKEDFLASGDETGFAALIRGMSRTGVLGVTRNSRYQHRKAMDGGPIYYHAITGVKKAGVSPELLAAASN